MRGGRRNLFTGMPASVSRNRITRHDAECCTLERFYVYEIVYYLDRRPDAMITKFVGYTTGHGKGAEVHLSRGILWMSHKVCPRVSICRAASESPSDSRAP